MATSTKEGDAEGAGKEKMMGQLVKVGSQNSSSTEYKRTCQNRGRGWGKECEEETQDLLRWGEEVRDPPPHTSRELRDSS